ncbi:MAG TPA: HPr family phosphocarrier protein [Sulfurovum sp.]|nr:HPr family phosphocarrier protein [Sulfurovum sp.]
MQFFKNLFTKTLSSTLTVTSSNGFHLRPVAKFISEAKKFKCDIHVSFAGKTVNAKAVSPLLSLNLAPNDSFTLSLTGKDAQEALNTLTETFQALMQEDKALPLIEKKIHHYKSEVLKGESIFEGVAIAPLFFYTREETFSPTDLSFQESVNLSLEELETLYSTHTHDEAGIYLAQKELLLSLSQESTGLDDFELHIHEASKKLKGGRFEAKITDYLDLLQRLKSHLGYRYESTFPAHPFVLYADDLLPSDITSLEKSDVQGVILKETSPTSHTAILLRASGIPSLILSEKIQTYAPHVILDTQCALLVPIPSAEDIRQATESQARYQHQIHTNHAKRFEHACTKTGKQISVYANISDIDSAKVAKEEGAEGIGLLRTEFLFGTEKPSQQAQIDAFEKIFSLFEHITVRTLDVGGDKALPYIQIPHEKNPFLGIRGVRLFQTHPELMEEQLYAIFTAAKHKPIKIMFPMISSVEEFNETKRFALHVAKKHTIDISHILFGIMIEVPSVLFLLKDFDAVVDFYSVGTNDLTQYLFAIERTHPTLQIDPMSPVVFSVLKNIVTQVKKPVSICGELASEKEAIPKLITLGLETLSVSAKSIASTKQEIRHV